MFFTKSSAYSAKDYYNDGLKFSKGFEQEKAKECFTKAAKGKHPKACSQLVYFLEQDVEKTPDVDNDKKIVYYAKRGAHYNDAQSQLYLANCYLNGMHGLPKSDFWALYYYHKVQDNPVSRKYIAQLEDYNLKCIDINLVDLDFQKSKANELGSGNYGNVYRGVLNYNNLQVPVAIKELQQALANDEEYLKLFKQEIDVFSKLKHPNIVKMYGICSEPPSCDRDVNILLVTELMHSSLYKLIYDKSNELNWPKIWEIALQIAYGLEYLQRVNIVHRDLKPENILINADATIIKLSDFGSAAIRRPNQAVKTLQARCTPIYMAPEVRDSKDYVYEKPADIYSLGVILWELAARKIPFQNLGSNVEDITKLIRNGQRDSIPDATPQAFANLITKCWAQNPKQRPTIEEVIKDLEDMGKIMQHDTVTLKEKVNKTAGKRQLEKTIAYQQHLDRKVHKYQHYLDAIEFPRYSQLANQGDSNAQLWLGFFYFNRANYSPSIDSLIRNLIKGIKWTLKSILKGNIPLWMRKNVFKMGAMVLMFVIAYTSVEEEREIKAGKRSQDYRSLWGTGLLIGLFVYIGIGLKLGLFEEV